jgi:hypothetical protein
MFNNAISLLGSHRARLQFISPSRPPVPKTKVSTYAQTMPGRLNMSLNPFFDSLNILRAVLQVFIDRLLIAIQEVWLRRFSTLNRHRPGTVLNSSGNVAWQGVGLGGGKIHVFGTGRRVEVKEGVLVMLVLVKGEGYVICCHKPYFELHQRKNPCDEQSLLLYGQHI